MKMEQSMRITTALIFMLMALYIIKKEPQVRQEGFTPTLLP
jgi:hypothetical protein